MRALSAASFSSPTTCGTVTGAGPWETVSWTTVLWGCELPSGTETASTSPAGMLSL
ncbi:hypothetical protein D3C74_481090 [compost metagenome]